MRNLTRSMQAVDPGPRADGLDSSSPVGQGPSQSSGLPADATVQVCDLVRWNDENRGAISDYNARIEREGLPLAKYRSFMKRG